MLRELDSRQSDSGRIEVTLYWNSESKDSALVSPLRVVVTDGAEGSILTVECDTTAEALDAFHHPFAVANSILKTGRIAA